MTFTSDALAGQHIAISGGCGALGRAVIKRLTDHGANMTVNDIIEPAEAEKRLQQAGVNMDRVAYVQADLRREEEVLRFMKAAQTAYGTVTTALCHAGMVLPRPILDITPEEWDDVMALNVKAAYLLGKAAAKAMLKADSPGLLVFTTSWVAETPWPEIGVYNTSKAAMNQMMRSFARELAPKGIRANALAPGIVGAGMAKQQWDTDPSYRSRAQKAIPLGYLQPLDSVADTFLYMCSPAAAYMTGTVLTVDGGCSLYPMD